MATLILRFIAGSFLKRFMMTAEGELKAGWTWITSSAVHALIAIVIVLCALLGFTRWHDSHVIAGKDRIIASQGQEIEGMKAQSAVNYQAQLDQKAHLEQHYKELAHDADTKHAAELASANDALARYLASHRVWGSSTADLSQASPAPESSGAGLPESAPAETGLVTVSEANLHVCAADYAYAKAAYDWALTLSAENGR